MKNTKNFLNIVGEFRLEMKLLPERSRSNVDGNKSTELS